MTFNCHDGEAILMVLQIRGVDITARPAVLPKS